jgi:hypothetical protein
LRFFETENEYDDLDVDPVFKLEDDIETVNYAKLNVETLDRIPKTVEDSEEEDAYID